MEIMQLMGDPIERKGAFDEFYKRYSSFLYNACCKSCWSFDSAGHLAEDIFQNVMVKVSEKGSLFKLPDVVDSIDAPRYIKAWLTRIASNELREFLRKNPDEKFLADPHRKRSSDLLDVTAVDEPVTTAGYVELPVSIQKDLLEKGILSLEIREREILMTYMQYFDPSRPNLHLPDEVLRAICDRYEITAQNVRQIKGRALNKLKNYFNENKVL
jgi:RNA polymerase sigma factor (sigma-70 family)